MVGGRPVPREGTDREFTTTRLGPRLPFSVFPGAWTLYEVQQMSIAKRASERFAALRAHALGRVEFDERAADPPDGWCISTIARLNANAPEMVPTIQRIQRALSPIADMYRYPAGSLHMSLLGCTQREARPQTEDAGRIASIRDVVKAVVPPFRSVRMRLGRVNLLGTQLFVEVVTDQDDWSRMRQELNERLLRIGESPIAYADTEPIHLNVCRIISSPDSRLLSKALTNVGLDARAEVLVSTIELVLTDFVVSPERIKVIDTFSLSRQPT
jgi:hypothetical protein